MDIQLLLTDFCRLATRCPDQRSKLRQLLEANPTVVAPAAISVAIETGGCMADVVREFLSSPEHAALAIQLKDSLPKAAVSLAPIRVSILEHYCKQLAVRVKQDDALAHSEMRLAANKGQFRSWLNTLHHRLLTYPFSLRDLAEAYGESGAYLEAVATMEQCLQLAQRTFFHLQLESSDMEQEHIARSRDLFLSFLHNTHSIILSHSGELDKALSASSDARRLQDLHVSLDQMIPEAVEDTRQVLLSTRQSLASRLRDTGKYREASEMYQTIVKDVEACVSRQSGSDIEHFYGLVLMNLANSYGSLREHKLAGLTYEKSIEVYRQVIARAPDDRDMLLEYGRLLCNASGNYVAMRDSDCAVKHARTAVGILAKLYPTSPDLVRLDYGTALSHVAGAFGLARDYSEALKYSNKAIDVLRVDKIHHDRDQVKKALAFTCFRHAQLLEACNVETLEVIGYFRQATDLLGEIYFIFDEIHDEYLKSLHEEVVLLLKAGKPKIALPRVAVMLKRIRELVASSQKKWQSQVERVVFELVGVVASFFPSPQAVIDPDDLSSSISILREALEILSGFATDGDELSNSYEAIQLTVYLAHLLARSNEPDEALELAEQCFNALRDVKVKDPVIGREDLLVDLANTFLRLGDKDRGRSLLNEAVGVERGKADTDDRHSLGLAISLYNLGDTLLQDGEDKQAVSVCEEAVEHFSQYVKRNPTAKISPQLGNALYNLIVALRLVGRSADAVAHCKRMVEAYEVSAQQTPELHQLDLADALSVYAAASYEAGDKENSIVQLRRAFAAGNDIPALPENRLHEARRVLETCAKLVAVSCKFELLRDLFILAASFSRFLPQFWNSGIVFVSLTINRVLFGEKASEEGGPQLLGCDDEEPPGPEVVESYFLNGLLLMIGNCVTFGRQDDAFRALRALSQALVGDERAETQQFLLTMESLMMLLPLFQEGSVLQSDDDAEASRGYRLQVQDALRCLLSRFSDSDDHLSSPDSLHMVLQLCQEFASSTGSYIEVSLDFALAECIRDLADFAAQAATTTMSATPDSRHIVSGLLRTAGTALFACRRSEEALDYCLRALKELESLGDEDQHHLAEIGHSNQILGAIHFDVGDIAEATSRKRVAIDLYTRASLAEPKLATSTSLILLYLDEDRCRDASELATETFNDLKREDNDLRPELLTAYADTAMKLGTTLFHNEEIHSGLGHLTASRIVYQRAVEQGGSDCLPSLAYVNFLEGVALVELERYDEAVARFEVADEEFEKLSEFEDSYLAYHANVLPELAGCYCELERWDEALECQAQAIDVQRMCVADDANETPKLASVLYQFARMNCAVQRAKHAEVALRECCELWRSLGDEWWQELTSSLRFLAECRFQVGDSSAALQTLRECVEALIEGIPTLCENEDGLDVDAWVDIARQVLIDYKEASEKAQMSVNLDLVQDLEAAVVEVTSSSIDQDG